MYTIEEITKAPIYIKAEVYNYINNSFNMLSMLIDDVLDVADADHDRRVADRHRDVQRLHLGHCRDAEPAATRVRQGDHPFLAVRVRAAPGIREDVLTDLRIGRRMPLGAQLREIERHAAPVMNRFRQARALRTPDKSRHSSGKRNQTLTLHLIPSLNRASSPANRGPPRSRPPRSRGCARSGRTSGPSPSPASAPSSGRTCPSPSRRRRAR